MIFDFRAKTNKAICDFRAFFRCTIFDFRALNDILCNQTKLKSLGE